MMRQLSLGKLDLELHINEAQAASENKNLDDLMRAAVNILFQP